ncbi:GvpL/GvpF family gas vesicle protein [Pseudonocardia sp. TRM90224]|uniref:GvpL/GvpF family gas vesicle protein n=1 Tax=Pseudonocardia sp. TRM90224 TaxID=2812678 RepID=UPI001E288BC6|nr:GvpL/GvpF family gas vesicle protein [Pseudonocardia sp. TRM90224]
MGEPLVYVYAVGDAALMVPELTGVDGAAVRIVVEGPLAAAVGAVDADRFGEDALQQSVEDLRWLEGTARAHDSVVAALAAENPVAPLRMATIYRDEDGVRALLRERAAAFEAALDRIRGKVEWGVKAYAVASPAPVAEPAPDAARPGTSYLLRRRAQRVHAENGRADAVAAAQRMHERLAGLAVASRVYPPQDPRLSGRREEMVLNAAYLVEAGDDAVRRTVAEAAQDLVRFELTGPWAAYSFATLEGDA